MATKLVKIKRLTVPPLYEQDEFSDGSPFAVRGVIFVEVNKIQVVLDKDMNGVVANNLAGFAVAFKDGLINLSLALDPEREVRHIKAVIEGIYHIALSHRSDTVIGQILPSQAKLVGKIEELLGGVIRKVPTFALEASPRISLKKLVANNPLIRAFRAFQCQRLKHLFSIFKSVLNLSQPLGVFND